jgi:hypothetical protein
MRARYPLSRAPPTGASALTFCLENAENVPAMLLQRFVSYSVKEPVQRAGRDKTAGGSSRPYNLFGVL